MSSKVVDYSLILDPQSPDFQQSIIQTINSHKYSSIDHASAEFLCFNPPITSIETKRGGIDQDNANLQLAIWTFSSFSFLRKLAHPEVELLPHICIVVLGYDCKLMVAQAGMMKTDTAVMHTDMLVGETSSIVGVCKLVLCIQILAEWGRQ